MTREEAIKTLEIIDKRYATLYPEERKALVMAIKALETLEEFEKAQIITGGRLNGRTYAYKCGLEDGKRKALEQDSCEDAISRQATIDKIRKHWISGTVTYRIADDVVNDINTLPPVTPKQKTGHWITKPHIYGVAFCSECGFELRIDDTKYCPNCGAKMERTVKE